MTTHFLTDDREMGLGDDEMTVPTTTAANLPTIIMSRSPPSTAGKPVPSSEQSL